MKQTAIAALTAILVAAGSGVAVAANDTTPATAQATAPAAAPAKPNSDEKIICRYDTPTGSRLGAKKTCMTKRQWADQSNNARDSMNHQFQGDPTRTH